MTQNLIKSIENPPKQDHTFQYSSLAVLCLAIAIIVIDGTVLNVSINDITKALNTDLKSIQWAITSYSLVIASLTILGGRIGDLFGRKRMFVLGAIIFGIGSLMTAFSQDINMLILGWSVVEGVGAALMVPASSALIISNFEPKDRGKAFGIYGATAGVASAIGPILGGFLTTNYGWRWAFGINIFVVAALVISSRVLKGYNPEEKPKINLDIPGVLLSSLGLASLSYGIIESSTYGWINAKKAWDIFGQSITLPGNLSVSLYGIAIGLVMLIAFVYWEYITEKKGNQPLITLSIFKSRVFTIGNLVTSVLFAGFTGIITFGIALFYQKILWLSAFDSGIGLIPLSLGIFLMAPFSSRLTRLLAPKRIIQIGLGTVLIASIMLYFAISESATRITMIPPLLIFGLGFGVMISQLSSITLSATSKELAGAASGIYGTVREVGRTFGSAIIGAVFLATLTSTLITGIENDTNIPSPVRSQLATNIKNADSNNKSDSEDCKPANLSSRSTPQTPKEKVAQAVQDEICNNTKTAIVAGNKEAIKYTGVFTGVAFVLSLFLPRKKETPHEV